jgi:predicted TIM-barrel fold metal-dependent hydrolase
MTRREWIRWSALAGLIVLALGLRRPAARVGEPALFDHHVHVLGPDVLRDWKALGASFSRADEAYLRVDALLGPAAGEPVLGGAWLVPMAHLYGNVEFREGLALSLADEQARVAAENDHVSAEAARHAGRAHAFVAVDLLRPYALEEIERVLTAGTVAGVKVHLASAGFDFRDAAHRALLERVAARVARAGLVLLLHLDPQRRGTETEDVRRLLEEALGPHPELRVVIAHLGGSGGFGPWTQAVLETATRWLGDERAAGRARPGVCFDLSAVPLARESEGVPATTEEELAALAPALRELGLERVLFASDYPVFDPAAHARFWVERCGLTEEEWGRVAGNRMGVGGGR